MLGGHNLLSTVKYNLLVLRLVKHCWPVNFVTFLNEDLIYFQLDSLSLNNLLFDTVLGDQSVYIHRLALSNSMSSIHSLEINLRIKIWVIQNHMVRRDQIYTQTTSPSRNQKNAFVSSLTCEVFDLRLSAGQVSTTVQTTVRYTPHYKKVFDDRKHHCKAGK